MRSGPQHVTTFKSCCLESFVSRRKSAANDQIMSWSWMGTFESAFCEFDQEKLLERVGLAKAAIDGRLHEYKITVVTKKRTL
jgi:hypothetical protein